MRRFFITAICFFIIAIVSTLYFLYLKQPIVIPYTPVIATTTPLSVEIRQIPEGWREYQNTVYDFSLFYPRELVVSEYQEGGKAMTITFQNIEQRVGFQIFVVPYHEQQISEERFKKDVPSGIRTNLSDLMIDTVGGASFYSRDVLLGETWEIWFIHNGWLYEVTAPRALDQWFSGIMRNWHFTLQNTII